MRHVRCSELVQLRPETQARARRRMEDGVRAWQQVSLLSTRINAMPFIRACFSCGVTVFRLA